MSPRLFSLTPPSPRPWARHDLARAATGLLAPGRVWTLAFHMLAASCRRMATCALATFFWFVPSVASAQEPPRPPAIREAPPREPSAAQAPAALRYREVFVPGDNLAAFVSGARPMERAEFERLLTLLSAEQRAARVGARVEWAEYAARLENGQLVAGQAELLVRPGGVGPDTLPWNSCNLALGAPYWRGADAPAPAPASLGAPTAELALATAAAPDGSLTPAELSRDAQGRVQLRTPAAGRLTFPFTLRGQTVGAGVEFDIRLPPALSNRLLLWLPPGHVPQAPGALAWRYTPETTAHEGAALQGFALGAELFPEEPPAPPTAPAAGSAALEPWLLELGARSQVRLTLTPARDASALGVSARREIAYEFTPQGFTAVVEWHLDVLDEPLREALLEVDPELQLASAQIGGRDAVCAWLPETTGGRALGPAAPGAAGVEGVSAPTRVARVEFPEPIRGVGRVLRVTAAAPLALDRVWNLPAPRLLGARWRQGGATLTVRDGLALGALRCHLGREVKAAVPAPPGAAVFQTRHYHADAREAALLARSSAAPRVDSVANIRLGVEAVSALVAAECGASRGEHFVLGADVSEPWLVESVETEPAEALLEWTFGGRTPGPRLRVRLQHPARAEAPVRLLVRARRAALATGETLDAAGLRILAFVDVEEQRTWAAVESEPPLRLTAAGDAAALRVEPARLGAGEAALISASPRAWVFRVDNARQLLAVGASFEPSRYSAEIASEALVGADSLRETHRLRIDPEGAQVQRLLVRFSHLLGDPPRWSLSPVGGPELVARRLPAAVDASGPPRESWEVLLSRPLATPFELRATRDLPFSAAADGLALVSLPEADTQSGQFTVRSELPLRVETMGLHPTPVAATPWPAYSDIRGDYRYEPSQDARLTLTRPAPPVASAAWCWRRDHVCLARDDRLEHAVDHRLENTGAGVVTLTLPPGGRWLELRLDGQTVTPVVGESATSESGPIGAGGNRTGTKGTGAAEAARPGGLAARVALPPGVRFPRLLARYTTPVPAWRWLGAIAPEPPKLSVPVLATRQELWLPPGDALAARAAPVVTLEPRVWARRLLGDWLRAPEEAPFDLFSASAWRGLARGDGLAPARDHAPSEWTDAWTECVCEATPTWGELLLAFESRLVAKTPAARVWVDAAALRDVGVAPDTRVAPPVAREPAAHAPRAHGLRWRAVPEGWVLASAWRDAEDDRRPLADWLAADRGEHGYWLPTGFAAWPELADAGWSLRPGPFSADAPAVVYRERAWRGAAAVLLFAVMVLVWRASAVWRRLAAPGRGRRVAWLGLVAAAAAAATASPAPWSLLAAGVFQGLLLGGLLALAAPRRPAIPGGPGRGLASGPGPGNPSESRARRAVAVGLCWALAAGLAAALGGAIRPTAAGEPERGVPRAPGQAAPEGKVYSVFVPVDERQRPVGSYVHLPLEFHDALYERDRALQATSRDWRLHSAFYECRFDPAEEPRDAQPRVRAEFEVEALREGVTLRLPLNHAEAHVPADGCRVDGLPLPTEWSADDRALLVAAPREGRMTLEVTLIPVPRAAPPHREIAFAIPSTPRARAEIRYPRHWTRVESPTALGAVVEHEPGVSRVDLGPAASFAARWTAEPEPRVVEAWHLNVRPGSVALDGRLRVTPRGAAVETFRVAVDPRLKLLPPSGDTLAAERRLLDTPEGPRLEIRLKEPTTSEFVLPVSLVWPGASGVGVWEAPRWRAAAAGRQRWWAVSVSSSLERELAGAPAGDSAALAEFQAVWGGALTPPPLGAWPLREDDEAVPRVATWPPGARTTVDEQVDISVGAHDMRVWYAAQVQTRHGPVFQHRLRTPPNLRLTKVSLIEGGVERVTRWAPADSGHVTLFCPGGVSGPARLLATGVVELADAPAPSPAPLVSLADAEAVSRVARLFRRPSALVEVTPAAGWIEDTQAPRPKPTLEGDRPLGVYRGAAGAAGDAAPELAIRPNQPRVACAAVTVLSRKQGAWWADWECHLRVDEGVLDALRLEVPGYFAGPFQIEPAAEGTLERLPGQTAARLVIRPAQPFRGEQRVRVRGPLTGERAQAPDIVPLEPREPRRYVATPRQIQDQQLVWKTSGLQEEPLPPELADALGAEAPGPFSAAATHDIYRAVAARCTATLRQVERTAGVPQIRLTDIRCLLRADGGVSGVAAFDLEPAGRRECVLETPPGAVLTRVAVAETPVTPRPEGGNQWRLPLGPPQLPQRLIVVYEFPPGASPLASSPLELTAPSLRDFPSERTLWTVVDEVPGGRYLPLERASQLAADQQELYRLKALVELVESAALTVSESSAQQTAAWEGPWKARWESSLRRRAALAVAVSPDDVPPDAVPREDADARLVDSLAARMLAARERLGARPADAPPAGEAPGADSGQVTLTDIWRQVDLGGSREAGSPALHCLFTGGHSRLALAARGDSALWAWSLGLAIGCCLLAAAAAAVVAEFRAARALPLRWPQACGVLLGLAWWLWLAPSLFGWALIALSVLAAVLPQRLPRPA